jgi:hypothetical protein
LGKTDFVRVCLAQKYLNITVFEYYDIIMVYHVVFYINPPNTCLETKYSKPWYLVDMKKLVIAMKTLSSSGVSNTPNKSWYLANYGIQNRVFYMSAKHLSRKNVMVFFNIIVLSQNFKNTLFPKCKFTIVLMQKCQNSRMPLLWFDTFLLFSVCNTQIFGSEYLRWVMIH